jgi:DNA-directed RNA polymerase specialized sigma24 family protein/anti-anti-sigma regulatory factor
MVEFPTASAVRSLPAYAGAVTTSRLGRHGTWVIALAGEHDRSTIPLLDAGTQGVWRRCSLVAVDLSAATFIDSSVIEWLLRTRRMLLATGHHGGLRVVVGTPASAASRLLRLVSPHLRELLSCHRTLEEALDTGNAHVAMSGVPHPPRAARRSEPVPTVFDQVEARAWVLAVWIVRDVQLADEIVTAAFAEPAGARPRHHDRLVREVRRRAIAAAPVRRAGEALPAEAVRVAIHALPEAQREAVELSLFGGLSIESLAEVTATPRAVVIDRLVDAMRVLRPMLGRRARDGVALAAALPVPPLRLIPPERWAAARGRSDTRRGGAVRRVDSERSTSASVDA